MLTAFAVRAPPRGGGDALAAHPRAPRPDLGLDRVHRHPGRHLWRFVPRINEALDARSEAIDGGIKRAEEAQAEAQAALEKYNAQLAEARGEAGRIRDAGSRRREEDPRRAGRAGAGGCRTHRRQRADPDRGRARRRAGLAAQRGRLAGDRSRIRRHRRERSATTRRRPTIVDRFLADLEPRMLQQPKANGRVAQVMGSASQAGALDAATSCTRLGDGRHARHRRAAALGRGRDIADSGAAARAPRRPLGRTAPRSPRWSAQIFSSLDPRPPPPLVDTIVGSRWSNSDELIDGIEQIGIRAIASARQPLDAEIESRAVRVRARRVERPRARTRGRQQARRPDGQGRARRQPARQARPTPAPLAIVRAPGAEPARPPHRRAAGRRRRHRGGRPGGVVATVTAAAPLTAAQQKRLAAPHDAVRHASRSIDLRDRPVRDRRPARAGRRRRHRRHHRIPTHRTPTPARRLTRHQTTPSAKRKPHGRHHHQPGRDPRRPQGLRRRLQAERRIQDRGRLRHSTPPTASRTSRACPASWPTSCCGSPTARSASR